MDRFTDNNTPPSPSFSFCAEFKGRTRAIYLAARCLFSLADETDSLEFIQLLILPLGEYDRDFDPTKRDVFPRIQKSKNGSNFSSLVGGTVGWLVKHFDSALSICALRVERASLNGALDRL